MSAFLSHLIAEASDDERTALLFRPLIYHSDLLNATVTVPEGFETDFASIPRILWNILPPLGRYGEPAIVHDFFYRTQPSGLPRAVADQVFLEAMGAARVGWLTRHTIYRAVRMFGWAAWNSNKKKLCANSQSSQPVSH